MQKRQEKNYKYEDEDKQQIYRKEHKEKYPIKKVKYVEKSSVKTKINQKDNQTTVINVKVKYLRQIGYNSLEEWLKNPNHVYIGRNMTHYVNGAEKSKWHNPFKVESNGRQNCLEQFKQYVINNKKLMAEIKELKGKVLGCWCHPEGCHGHILAELADQN